MKLTCPVLLFGIVVSAFKLNHHVHSFEEDKDIQEFDQTEFLDEPETNKPVQFQDFGGELNDEIKAIQGHVKYQDAARSALLKFAAELRKGKNVTNAFLKVIDGFEKGIAEFHAAFGRRRVKTEAIEDVKDFITEAVKDRTSNTKILRALTSQGLFLAERLGEVTGRKRSLDLLDLGAESFLNTIKEEIGEEPFEDYLSISGLVTLIFAIDDTGSMGNEIKAAIAISEQIVKAPRDYDVDYILSPFNDPGTGPVTRKNQTEGADFLTALKSLRAHGGGDCPELAFKGMIDALELGPQPGSSMFVFTDASPKDGSEANKEILLSYAHSLDIKINFFTTGWSCGSSDGLQSFKDIATETGGLQYPLKNTLELAQLGKLVASSLQGSVPIGSGVGGSGSRRKRGSEKEYLISVDDSIEKMSISVTTQNSGSGIRLINPNGNLVTESTPLSKGIVYNIDKPKTGKYKLIIPASAGDHKYKVNGISGINVGFSHYYVLVARRGRRIPVPLDQPLQGFPAKAFISIAGAESVKPSSLRMKVVDDKGSIHADVPMTSVGTSGVRYFIRFCLPNEPFKLQLHGQTVKGNPFVRESSRNDQTVPVILKLSHKAESNVLRRGESTRITLKIYRGDAGNARQRYILSLKDHRGYGRVSRQPRPVYRGRVGFGIIEFNVPSDAPAGKTENVELFLTREREKIPVASLMISLLLI